jgi:hypothetical protein
MSQSESCVPHVKDASKDAHARVFFGGLRISGRAEKIHKNASDGDFCVPFLANPEAAESGRRD